MSTVQRIEARGRAYTTVPDVTTFYDALMVGTVLDELTEEPLQAQFTVRADRVGVAARRIADGLYGATGRWTTLFRTLPSGGLAVRFVVEAAGYAPGSADVLVTPGAALPLTAPTITLRRLPISIRGRLTRSETDATPVPGRRIDVVDRPAQHVTILRSPARFPHDVGVQVRARRAVPATTTTIAAATPTGSRTVAVTDASGFSVAGVDAVRVGAASVYEYGLIVQVDLGRHELRLAAPLARSLAAGAPAVAVALQAPVPPVAPTQLHRAVTSGEGMLILDSYLDARTVEILDPDPARREVHATGAVTGSGGWYRMDGVTGVAEVDLKPAPPPATPPTVTWRLDYGRPVNVVDLLTKP